MFSKTLWRAMPAALAVLAGMPLGAGAGEAARRPANLFENPGFEDGRGGWQLDKAGKTEARFTVDQAAAAEGKSSALVTIGRVEEWGTQFGQTMDAGAKGKTYTFAVMARGAQAPVDVTLEIERRGEPYDRAARSETFTLGKEAWTELHVTFKVDKDFREGWFAYVSCTQPNAEYRADAFRLYEGQYVPYAKAAKEAAAATGVTLYDTGAWLATPRSGEEVLAKKAGWVRVPEGDTAHKFKGEAVLTNDRLALVLSKGNVAVLYSLGPEGATRRASLAPIGEVGCGIGAVAVAKNGADAVGVDVTFGYNTTFVPPGKPLGLRFELAQGQAFIKTEPRAGVTALEVHAMARFLVLPDFFADDIAFDATEMPANIGRAELPSENFLLHMLADNAVLMTVATSRDEDVPVTLWGEGAGRIFTSSLIPYGKDGKVWVAVLEAPGIWHTRNVARDEAGKIIDLPWKAPFPAQWRMDWRKADQLVDSWEMIAQKRGGEFEKPGVFGDPSTLPADRKRWTTVLGSFKYPCWIDQGGQGHIQPLKSDAVRFEGPALIYPINRVRATPLAQFTVADIMRATLGVGPCEYILDVEGQGSHYKGRATCAARDALRPIYSKNQQKEKRAEIERVLDEVMAFVRHIRGRIDGYAVFGHKTLAYLDEQEKAHPELASFAGQMRPLCKAIDGYVEKRRNEIKTVEYTQGMVDQFRRTMIDYEGDDAFARCKKFTEDLVQIGGSQDELAGECRMAVKIIRQRAAMAAAVDPRAAEAAKEIRRRTQEVMRNPASHEGARH